MIALILAWSSALAFGSTALAAPPRITTTTVTCGPATVGVPTTCAVTVSDTSKKPSTPTGAVTFSRSGSGTFSSGSCKLAGGSCSVSFTPAAGGAQTITATYGGGGKHAPSTGATIVSPGKATQTTSFTGAPASAASGSSFTVSSTTNSTSVPVYSASGVCTSSGATYTMTGSSGTCTSTVSWAADATYNGATRSQSTQAVPSAVPTPTPTPTASPTPTATPAPTPTATPTPSPTPPAGQTITFPQPASPQPYGASFTVIATSSSGLDVTITGSGGCAVSGTTVTMTSATTSCALTASQSGSAGYSPAAPVVRTIDASRRTTATAVGCQGATVDAPVVCTVQVTATSGGSQATPEGTVSFTTGGAGAFSPTSCTLSGGVCSVSFTPSSASAQTITGSYGGDPTSSPSSGLTTIAAGLRSTSTVIACDPTTPGIATTCTASVSDSSSGSASTPGGSVSFSAGGSGTLAPASCALTNGECSVSFTPVSATGVAITATYGGDATHRQSAGTTTAGGGGRSTSTTLALSCASATAGAPSNCVVSVQDTASGASSTPTGTVAFSASNGGSFDPTVCTLDAGSCSTTLTAGAAGSITITATYSGDSVHSPSSGTSTASVGVRPTGTAVECGSAKVGVATVCVARVTDTGTGVRSTPGGTVAFSASGGGVLGAASCALSAGSCSVTYTPTTPGLQSVTAGYGGDATHTASSGTGTLTGTGNTGSCVGRIGPGIPPPAGLPAGVPGFHAQWYGQSGYPTLCAGERSIATVAFYNSGARGWVSGRLGEVAYLGTWETEPGQDLPSSLGGDGTFGSPDTGWPRYNRIAIQPAAYVAPDQVAWFQFTIQAPAAPGRYRLYLRPLVEGANWMEDFGVFWPVIVLNDDGTPPPP